MYGIDISSGLSNFAPHEGHCPTVHTLCEQTRQPSRILDATPAKPSIVSDI